MAVYRHILKPGRLGDSGRNRESTVDSDWLNGPSFLRQNSSPIMPDVEHNMDIDENDPEVRSTVNVCATDAVPAHGLGLNGPSDLNVCLNGPVCGAPWHI